MNTGRKRGKHRRRRHASREPQPPPSTSTVRRGKRFTFAEFTEEWHRTASVQDNLRESTIRNDAATIKNHLIPAFGHLRLRRITPKLIDEYKGTKLRQNQPYGTGYTTATINNHLSLLRRIFDRAITHGLLQISPVLPTVYLKVERGPDAPYRWWTYSEQKKAIEHLRTRWRSEHLKEYIALMIQLTVGLRCGELLALEKRDLDFSVPGLWVRRARAFNRTVAPKGNRQRFHVIPRGLADELHDWCLRTASYLVVPGREGGYASRSTLNRWYGQLSAEAGVREITSHGARYTCASAYALLGANQKFIADVLGHASTSTTDRYTQLYSAATATLIEQRWLRLTSGEAPQPAEAAIHEDGDELRPAAASGADHARQPEVETHSLVPPRPSYFATRAPSPEPGSMLDLRKLPLWARRPDLPVFKPPCPCAGSTPDGAR